MKVSENFSSNVIEMFTKMTKSVKSIFIEAFVQAMRPLKVIHLRRSEFVHAILPDGFGCFELIFFKHIYFDPEIIHNADVIIDLGAHQGSFTVYSLLYMKPKGLLIAVEPNPKAYSVLLENINLYKDLVSRKKIRIYALNKAISLSKGFAKLKLSRWSTDSYLSDNGDFCVETVTLEDLFNLFKFIKNPNILLKMNIEGAEYNLVADERSLRCLRACRYIAVQPHGDPNVLKRALERLGFTAHVCNVALEPALGLKWLNYKPKLYSSVIAVYRLAASSLSKPKVTIVKAERR